MTCTNTEDIPDIVNIGEVNATIPVMAEHLAKTSMLFASMKRIIPTSGRNSFSH